MINLRYHIVSITAVFLALAIGILMGTSLLNRATVDTLRNTQERLEARIRERSQENAAFREAVQQEDAAAEQFDGEIRPALTAGLVTDPVLIVAARGIDESVIAKTRAAITDAGGADLGTLWIEPAAVLEDDTVRAQVGAVLGATAGAEPAAVRKLLIDALAAGLGAPRGGGPTTTVPTDPPAAPAPDQSVASLDTLVALTSTGALTWDLPGGAVPALPSGSRRVLLSGEGAPKELDRVVEPLVRAIGRSDSSALVVGEVMAPRSTSVEIERRLGDQQPIRGAFVDTFRADRTISSSLVTIDDIDRPTGRLSLVLVLSQPPGSVSGAYGTAGSAAQQYPTIP